MKIVILGSQGMLGLAVTKYFENNFVTAVNFNERFSIENSYEYMNALNQHQPDFIINCIGSIPQKNKDLSDYYISNIVLPAFLISHTNSFIIQPSTDCIFDSDDRRSSIFPDSQSPFSAKDQYGISKAIGDLAIINSSRCIVVRTSIIGLTKNNTSGGLLDWLVKNKNGSVNGFCNHLWNGITTDAWINWVYDNVIRKPFNRRKSGVIHLGSSDFVSKYEILSLLNQIMGLNIKINKIFHGKHSDRRLKPDYQIDTVETLLKNTVKFWS